MISLAIVPGKSIGTIPFSTDRYNVRSIFGTYKEFKKSKSSKNSSDDFGFCHAYYDEDNKLEAVEFFENVSLLYENTTIYPADFESFKAWLKQHDKNSIVEDDGCTSELLSISIYAPGKSIESVLIGREHYFL